MTSSWTADPNVLIRPEELAAVLSAEDPPVLADVRWNLTGPPGRPEYEAGHIPGAQWVDLEAELSAPPGEGGRHPLPTTATFEQAMRRIRLRAGPMGAEIAIVAEYDKAQADVWHGTGADVALEVRVPRNSNLDIHTGDGRVRVSGVSGEINLRTGDGAVDVSEGRGRLKVQTGDGRVRIAAFDGDVDALEAELEARGKTEALDRVRRATRPEVRFVVQEEALGRGHAVGVAAGLAPLWQAIRMAPNAVLSEGVRASAAAPARRLSKAFVVVEIALAFTLLTTSAVDVIDGDCDVIVELIGGVHSAGAFVRRAIANGRHVVTANKALLAQSGAELFDAAGARGVTIG